MIYVKAVVWGVHQDFQAQFLWLFPVNGPDHPRTPFFGHNGSLRRNGPAESTGGDCASRLGSQEDRNMIFTMAYEDLRIRLTRKNGLFFRQR